MRVIGVDLGGTNLRVGLLQDEQVLWKQTVPTAAWRGKDAVIADMIAGIRQALAQNGDNDPPVAGIGIGMPGPVNPFTGIVDAPPNLPGWEQVPLCDLVSAAFALPVYVNNDANCAALGEWLYGAGSGHDHMVYVTVSTGIGGGVISEGTLLVGADGGAAEIGHACVQVEGGAPCNCGRAGCLEAYASGTAMVRYAGELLQTAAGAGSPLLGREQISPADIAQAAAAGDAVSIAVMERSRRYLGAGLANVLTLYNPSALILGGGLTNLWDELIVPALAQMRRLTFALAVDRLVVARPAFGDDAGLVGAAALVTYHGGRKFPQG